MRNKTATIVFSFTMIIVAVGLCYSAFLPQRSSKELSSTGEGENSMQSETMPAADSCSQVIPIIIATDTDASDSTATQRLFSEEDFASLVEGKSTLADLRAITGDYPAMSTSYGCLYHFSLIDGNTLSIRVDVSGVIIDIYYS